MASVQADLFAQDTAERKALSEAQRAAIRARLEATLLRLQDHATFPWRNPLDAVHEENRFERDSQSLGPEGEELWARFDEQMDRLHATRDALDGSAAELAH